MRLELPLVVDAGRRLLNLLALGALLTRSALLPVWEPALLAGPVPLLRFRPDEEEE